MTKLPINEHSTLPDISSSNNGPTWCEEQQIYINGTIASSTHAEDYINSILSSIVDDDNNKEINLHIFGYGSLCWNPGSNDEVLANVKVKQQVAKAIGWKRCWCQKSTDHRGNVSFPGLVCTLLSDDEINSIIITQKKQNNSKIEGSINVKSEISLTEGVLYTIPCELIEQCLAELDFREKGGYARDIIDVEIQDGSLKYYQKALLYRGTPDNPAFSKRALLDPFYAASIMAVATGPSGSNDEYLYNLDTFLSTTISRVVSTKPTISTSSSSSSSSKTNYKLGDIQTKMLASLTKTLQNTHNLYFLLGAGSNQHNQLLLDNTIHDENDNFVNAADLVDGEDSHLLNDIFLITPTNINSRPKSLYAGGGHSALLTEHNDLYLWGWNEYGQLGRNSIIPSANQNKSKLEIIEKLNFKVVKAALGHSHTLIIEEGSHKLYTFGDDSRGQVSGHNGGIDGNTIVQDPILICENEQFIDIDAGVFHSAGITTTGELITFGCGKFHQTLPTTSKSSSSSSSPSHTMFGRWKPDDGSKLIKVKCGRRHTIILDEHGRVWTMGENKKYGQLGRNRDNCAFSNVPELVDGTLGQKGSGCIDIDCGWSHSVAVVDDTSQGNLKLYGWGRSDKSQFGIHNTHHIDTPHLILENNMDKSLNIRFNGKLSCGSESLIIQEEDGQLYGCGWNEHGNLATGVGDDSVRFFTKVTGAKIRNYYNIDGDHRNIIMASGGAHLLVAML